MARQPAEVLPVTFVASPEESTLVRRLRARDEAAFTEIVDGWSPTMLRVARSFVSTDASAQEIVQETWLAALRGLDRFEGRSSLRTWVFRILSNLAKTRGVRESRTVPWSSFAPDDEGPTVDPERFLGLTDPFQGHWTDDGIPRQWEPPPDASAIAGEIRRLLAAALQLLPERQRVVVTLRDVHGQTTDEICASLGITPTNQRVLLHRGRARLRTALEDYYMDRETVRVST